MELLRCNGKSKLPVQRKIKKKKVWKDCLTLVFVDMV